MTIYKVIFPTRNNTMISLVDEKERYGETYIECSNYVSRSGATYDLCYEFNEKGEPVQTTGLKPISEVLMTYIKEGLWHYAYDRMPPKEFRDYGEELNEAMRILNTIYDDGLKEYHLQYLLIRISNGFTVYVKRFYDIRRLLAIPEPVVKQSNLEVYSIEPIIRVKGQRVRHIEISGHTVAFTYSVIEIAKRETSKIQAVLVYNVEENKIVMAHPEHDTVKFTLEPGLYLFIHIRTHQVD